MVMETMWWGHRYRAYHEAVPGAADRGKLPFEDWCNIPGNEGDCHIDISWACTEKFTGRIGSGRAKVTWPGSYYLSRTRSDH